MKTKRAFCLMLAVCMIICLCACGAKEQPSATVTTAPARTAAAPSSGSESAPALTLKFAHVVSEEHPYNDGVKAFKEKVEELSGGKIVVEIYPNGQLGSERDLMESVALGSVDIIAISNGPVANFDSRYLIFDLPWVFENREVAFKCLDGELGVSLLDGLSSLGIKGLSFWDASYINFWNSKQELLTPDDVSGQTIRVLENELYMAFMQSMNVNPVPVAFSEVYTALQNKTVDGAVISAASGVNINAQTVAPFYSEINAIYAALPVMMNLDLWNSLSAEYQGWIIEAMEYAKQIERNSMYAKEISYMDLIEAEGGTVTHYTPDEQQVWIDATKDAVWDQFIGTKISQSDIDLLMSCK